MSAKNLSYDLHGRRELAEDDHCLHRGRELEASILEISKVAKHFGDSWSRMGASRDGSCQELAKLGIGGVTHQTCLVLWTWRKLANKTNAKNTPKIY